ncbi:MAG: DUF885 family protein [Phycisphaerae bacterium]
MNPAHADKPAGGADSAAAAALHRLFDERYQWQLREFPEYAMSRGVYTHADRVTDESLAALERRERETQAVLNQLGAIDRAALDDADRVNLELFDRVLREQVDARRFRMYLAPIDARSGPHQEVPQMHERVRFASYADYDNYLQRLSATPRELGHLTERLRLGYQEGRTPAAVALRGIEPQFESLIGGGALREIARPFDNLPAGVTEAQRAELKDRFEKRVYPELCAAMRAFGEFLAKEYLPNCRKTIAAVDLPDGEAFYAFELRRFTTTDLTARQIHGLGLREVARIRAEMMQVIRKTDFLALHPQHRDADDAPLFAAFIAYLRSDPRFYCRTEQDLLARYREICKRIDAELPRLFRTLPRLTYGVRKIPDFMAPSQTTAYYQHGDLDNAEPGWFYANCYALDQRPTYEMVALALHEAVPGHHFQIALAQEMEDTPEFRKDAWFTAFGEGWALYGERLGIEMGLYADPYDDFGRLLYEMWRACRLVVDPGMHALGWSRERAVQYMRDNTALSEVNINAEIDRYIAWPGQATAYKIGELRIRALREKAQAALGERLDLRRFHDRVLEAGTIPLTLLEQRVEEWIAGERAKSGER